MTRHAKYLSAALPTLIIVLVMGYIGTATFITAQLTHRVATLSPDSRGISTHIPLSEVAEDLTSPDIHSATIQIASFHTSSHNAQGSTNDVSQYGAAMSISAQNIAKSSPFTVDSLDITATIAAKTLEALSGFPDARISNGELQVSVGSNGLGQALLTPKVSNNQLYFVLQSISLFGTNIPASSLPASIQDQIKARSVRNLSFPKGLAMTSVVLKSQGMVITLHGSDFALANLNSAQ